MKDGDTSAKFWLPLFSKSYEFDVRSWREPDGRSRISRRSGAFAVSLFAP